MPDRNSNLDKWNQPRRHKNGSNQDSKGWPSVHGHQWQGSLHQGFKARGEACRRDGTGTNASTDQGHRLR